MDDPKEKKMIDKDCKYMLSFSGGKDSTASAIIAHKLGLEVTIVYAHFYFDKSKRISATLPEHEEFIQNVIFPRLRSWGFKIIQVEPDTDFVTLFRRKKIKGPSKGSIVGWPPPIKSHCWANKDLKMAAIRKAENICKGQPTILGIAYDEQERADRLLSEQKISLLYEYKITEARAKRICEKWGLLSPLYSHQQRDGCWFCNQMNIAGSQYIDENHPELVNLLKELDKEDLNFYFARGQQSVEEFYGRRYKIQRKEDAGE